MGTESSKSLEGIPATKGQQTNQQQYIEKQQGIQQRQQQRIQQQRKIQQQQKIQQQLNVPVKAETPESQNQLNSSYEEMASKNKNVSGSSPAVEKKAADPSIHPVVQEVQTNSRFILKRLNQVIQRDKICACECHSKYTAKDVQELRDRVEQLEKNDRQKDDLIIQILSEMKLLKQAIGEVDLRAAANSKDMLKDPSHRSDAAQGIVNGDGAVGDITLSAVADKQPEPRDTAWSGIVSDLNVRVGLDGNVTDDIKTVSQRKCGADKAVQLQESELLTESGREQAGGESDGSPGEAESGEGSETEENGDEDTAEGAAGDGSDTRSLSESHQSAESQPGTPRENEEKGPDQKTRSAIPKANFLRAPKEGPVAVIQQKQSASYDFNFTWSFMADRERAEAHETLHDLGSVHSIFCVDISASMAEGDAWTQAQKFVNDYIDGIEEWSSTRGVPRENVALVTFGHETKVVLRLSDNYDRFRQTFNAMKLGGPSPLYGGLMMTMAAALASDKLGYNANGLQGGPKVFLITDGYPTATCLHAGPDVVEPRRQEETRNNIFEAIMQMNRFTPTFSVIPVGRADMELISLVASLGDGLVKNFKDGRKMSRRTFLMLEVSPNPLRQLLGMRSTEQTEISESDQEHVEEIMADHYRREKQMKDSRSDVYQESDSTKLPPPGSRVRRGPDWKWDDQDSDGPGTVTGHANDGQIHVEWDLNGRNNIYRYGGEGCYDVLLVDDQRVVPRGGKIAVGCVVKPGRDWRGGDPDIRQTDTGAVIKVVNQNPRKVQVRWKNKSRGDYECDQTGKMEVEMYDATEQLAHAMAFHESNNAKKQKNKNKNAPK